MKPRGKKKNKQNRFINLMWLVPSRKGWFDSGEVSYYFKKCEIRNET